ncbi:uncharacterized protein LOC110975609 [Acanthaster planci]|uniref:Uncharacterized protein LOC110975609 n=1 Tax=Acanthaster planci TaxID=133434 RepID=A0A8B7XSQ3_ACAPL|nr:uncharacterized protein LOC110975609 [Acanthaster planci]
MDGQGDDWSVDGTLPQFLATVPNRLSPAHNFELQGSSSHLSHSLRNAQDALEFFKQPQQSSLSPFTNQSLDTELPDFCKLPWDSTEQSSSDLGDSVRVPSLDVENLCYGDSGEAKAAQLENNEQLKSVGLCLSAENESSWSCDMSSSELHSAPRSRSYDNPSHTVAGQEAHLADELLLPTPTVVESENECIGQNCDLIPPVNPFSQLAMQTKKSSDQYYQSLPLANEYVGLVTEPCIQARDDSCHAASNFGSTPQKNEENIPMQSSLLTTVHQTSSDVLHPNARHCQSRDYLTNAGQTTQDFISIESNLSDGGINETDEGIKISDDFSLNYDPPSFSDGDSDIKSPELSADLTRISNNAEQWCFDPSSLQDEEHSSGITNVQDGSSLSPVSPERSFQDIVGSGGQQKQEIETQNKDEISPCSTYLGCSTVSESNCSLLQLDTNNKDIQESRQNGSPVDEKDPQLSQNTSSSALTRFVNVPSTKEASEISSHELELASELIAKTSTGSVTDTRSFQLNSNKLSPGQHDGKIGSDLNKLQHDISPVPNSGSSDSLSPRQSEDDASSLRERDNSLSSEESVLLISDFECDAEIADNKTQDTPINVKIKNLPSPDEACQNKTIERTEPDSTTRILDHQGDTKPEARSSHVQVCKGQMEGNLTNDDSLLCNSPSDASFDTGATLSSDRYTTESPGHMSGNGAYETVSYEEKNGSPDKDTSVVGEETERTLSEDKNGEHKLMATATDSDVEEAEAELGGDCCHVDNFHFNEEVEGDKQDPCIVKDDSKFGRKEDFANGSNEDKLGKEHKLIATATDSDIEEAEAELGGDCCHVDNFHFNEEVEGDEQDQCIVKDDSKLRRKEDFVNGSNEDKLGKEGCYIEMLKEGDAKSDVYCLQDTNASKQREAGAEKEVSEVAAIHKHPKGDLGDVSLRTEDPDFPGNSECLQDPDASKQRDEGTEKEVLGIGPRSQDLCQEKNTSSEGVGEWESPVAGIHEHLKGDQGDVSERTEDPDSPSNSECLQDTDASKQQDKDTEKEVLGVGRRSQYLCQERNTSSESVGGMEFSLASIHEHPKGDLHVGDVSLRTEDPDSPSNSECLQDTDASKQQDEGTEKEVLGVWWRSQDLCQERNTSSESVGGMEFSLASIHEHPKGDQGYVSHRTEEPESPSNSEKKSPNQNAVRKTTDTDPVTFEGSFSKLGKISASLQEKENTNVNPQMPEGESHKKSDDDIIILDDDPEVISIGSSDEDEGTESSASKQKQLTTATTRSPSKTTVKTPPQQNTQWACHICGDHNKTLNSLKLHVRRVHNLIMVHRKEDMKCKLCSFVGTWQKIKEHIINDHDTPLKWYIKNHETREITKLPLSASVPSETPQSQGNNTAGAQASHPAKVIAQKTAAPASKQHYLIKRVSNISMDGQDERLLSVKTKDKQMLPSSKVLTLSHNTPSLSAQPVGLSITPKVSSVMNVHTPTVSQVQVCPATTVPKLNTQNKVIIIRHATPAAATKTVSIVTTGKNAVVTQGGVHNNSRNLYPVVPSVVHDQQGTKTTPTLLRSKVGNSVIAPPVTKTGVEQTIQVSAVVTHYSTRQITYRANTGKQYKIMTSPVSPKQQIITASGLPSSLVVPRKTAPQGLGVSTASSQVMEKVRNVSGTSQPASQQNPKTFFRIFSNQTAQGSPNNTRALTDAAKAPINFIKSSNASAPAKTMPLSKQSFTYSVSALPNTVSNSSTLSKLGLNSLPSSGIRASAVHVPSTMTIIKTVPHLASQHVSGASVNQSSASVANQKVQTVTTPSSGLVTSSKEMPNITVQRHLLDGDSMASYVIRVPKSQSESMMHSLSNSGKKHDDSLYLVKVPVNHTDSPKKFMVHLPVEKGSTMKHAVCIVQPPAGESDREVSPVFSKSSTSNSHQGKPVSLLDGLSTSLGQIKSISPMSVGLIAKTSDVSSVVPLCVTKAKKDPTKKAECLAHLQEPAVNIQLLEDQFKNTEMFKAADLIKLDSRVQFECARCKEAFPQLMLLQLHHIDCTAHPPSQKILPIVHIPTAVLAAFFTLSASGYSSACVICKVLLLGNARHMEDQQDFCSHLSKHTEPRVAITSLDDTRKLGILQTRMTSQQAKEWVDYLVPPFKMCNKPTSAYDGSLDEYICTGGILHRESVKRSQHKRSLSPETRRREKHKKHKKHKRHRTPHIEISGRSNEGTRNLYQSSLKTAEGCEGEWIEPSPKDSGKLWVRRKPRAGGLKESIMTSPSHPKLLQHGMRVNLSKSAKTSPSKTSQRFLNVKIPGRRSQRGMGLDFGQGLVMLPMTTRKRKKKTDEVAKEQMSGILTRKVNMTPAAPSCSSVLGDKEDLVGPGESSMSNKSTGRHASKIPTVSSVQGQEDNTEVGTDIQTKDPTDDIVVITSSDDDGDDAEAKEDDTQDGDKSMHTNMIEGNSEEPNIGKVDADEESDSKDAASDNPYDDSDSSLNENANGQQSDSDEDIDDDKDGMNQRDIPLTMMALHYRRLNEEMAKTSQEKQDSEEVTCESPSLTLSVDKLEEDTETQTAGDQDAEKTTESHPTWEIVGAVTSDKLQDSCSSHRLKVISPVPTSDCSNLSGEFSSQSSGSLHSNINVESSTVESESLESEEFHPNKQVKQSTSQHSNSSSTCTQFGESSGSKPEETLPSEPCKDTGSELLREEKDMISPQRGIVDNDLKDNTSGASDQENCISDIEDHDPSSEIESLEDAISNVMATDNLQDLKSDTLDKVSVEGSFGSENRDQDNVIFVAADISDTKNSDNSHSMETLSEMGNVKEQSVEDLEGNSRDDDIKDHTTEDSKSGSNISEIKIPSCTYSNIQDSWINNATDGVTQINNDFRATLLENDSSGESKSADETWKRKSQKDTVSEDHNLKDSIQKDKSLKENDWKTDIWKEDIPMTSNLKEHSQADVIQNVGTKGDATLNDMSGKGSVYADGISWDSCVSNAESSVQRDRFFREKNLTKNNVSDGSQTDEAVEQVTCTTEEEESDITNETKERDRFFSERSLDIEDSFGSQCNDRLFVGGVCDDISCMSYPKEDIRQDQQSDGLCGQDSGAGETQEEGQETRLYQDDDQDSDDDVICLIDDSDEEFQSLLSTDQFPGLEWAPSTVHTVKEQTVWSTSADHPSQTLGKPVVKQVRGHSLKRKSSHDYEDDELDSDSDSPWKHARGREACDEATPSDSWRLLEVSEESEEHSAAEMVWKQDRGTSVFTHEDVGQLRAGGL